MANSSTNAYISQSCQYIIQNKITASTSQYSKALGFTITVQFLTVLNQQYTMVSVDSSSNTIEQLVTSTSTSTNNYYTTTTTTDDDGSGSSTTVSCNTGSIVTIAAISLALLIVLLIMVTWMLGVLNGRIGALAGAAAGGPRAIEMSSNPMGKI